MTGMTAARLDLGGDHPVNIHSVGMGRPWAWLRAGWRDMMRSPTVSLGYGLLWVGVSFLLVGGLWFAGQGYWLLPLLAGFMLMGPLVAVGTYAISRSLERGEEPDLNQALRAWQINTTQIALMGVLLMVFLLAWIRFATLLFALFFGTNIPTADTTLIYTDLLFSTQGIGLIIVGTALGAVLAFAAFALSVVSIPRLLDQPKSSVLEATITSLAVVQKNLKVMLLWGFILSAVTFLGLAAGIIGLAVALPLLGHASWHAYRELVSEG
jgi:uncharacterized membrane protein